MGRLIDADRFKSRMLDEPTEWMTEEQLVQFRAMIDLAPTVDAVPVKHGRWECGDKYENAVCSVCGYDTGEAYGFGYGNGCYNFCPMCGADMRMKRGRKGR